MPSVNKRFQSGLSIFKYFILRILNVVKIILPAFNRFIFFFSNKFEISIISSTPVSDEELNKIRNNIEFYLFTSRKPKRTILKSKIGIKDVFSYSPVLIMDNSITGNSRFELVMSNIYFINPASNPSDTWDWSKMSSKYNNIRIRKRNVRLKFQQYIKTLKNLKLEKAYILGTGPSLEKAIDENWDDGYRIVCNTIVKDKKLWNKIKPHFIVAADCLYHFSNEKYAVNFRSDLFARLMETQTFFLYPSIFHSIVIKEAPHLSSRLIPISFGKRSDISYGLDSYFELPQLGNILNMILLPLACTLTKNVYLWGFDGRAPSDTYFWSNSNKHSYQEHFHELTVNHPAFFSHYVPENNPNKYVADVHGQRLEDNLVQAETLGWKFIMMHKTWTPVLQKRFISDK